MDADVIVPLMTRIDAPLLRRAARAKLILQFGVGVEGVDIQEVRGKISSEGGRRHLAGVLGEGAAPLTLVAGFGAFARPGLSSPAGMGPPKASRRRPWPAAHEAGQGRMGGGSL